jgi:hypothetical protein
MRHGPVKYIVPQKKLEEPPLPRYAGSLFFEYPPFAFISARLNDANPAPTIGESRVVRGEHLKTG